MSKEDFERLAPHFECVKLPRGHKIIGAGQQIREVYFLEFGIGSIVASMPEGAKAEVGLFGFDGMSPVELAMGSEVGVHDVFIQVADDAWRVAREPFMAVVETSAPLRLLLSRYSQAMAVQTAHTALSNAVNTVDERLARWLLMCADRTHGDLALTHEFIAIMLAVRRPSVTTALHVLEGEGLVRTERRCIVIRDRHGLEAFAGGAYGPAEAEYRRLIGPLHPSAKVS